MEHTSVLTFQFAVFHIHDVNQSTPKTFGVAGCLTNKKYYLAFPIDVKILKSVSASNRLKIKTTVKECMKFML